MKSSKLVVISIALFSIPLTGCLNTARPNDPAYAPVALKHITPPMNRSGSIYQAGYERTLFEDMRARRIGDILTINLAEVTAASKSALTTMDKTTEIDTGEPVILGKTPKFSARTVLPGVNSSDNTLQSTNKAKHKFNGLGVSNQSNNITGTITVTVSDVLPNGNLVVRGEKWMNLNRGDEYIRITGIVRPQDITSNNVVESSRVADARITYSGTGEVAESNSVGWLAKFFMGSLWPL